MPYTYIHIHIIHIDRHTYKNNTEEDMRNCLIKLQVHLEKRLRKIGKKKTKKLHKLSGSSAIKDNVSTRFH